MTSLSNNPLIAEPSHDSFGLANENARLNGMEGEVEARNAALGTTSVAGKLSTPRC